ncbi:hypothetical protein Goshw_022097 [Gossypium schwendimanii]|uniref:Uncharacterized protein n=1 Tax=Gossypium schwendimanii TaxID=34291 RepID=A0A7J9LHK1_GOSSC|nr:hypothetical protein [Gossypium schwendimanii]
MKACIKSTNEKASHSILIGWQTPMIDTEAKRTLIFELEWTTNEECLYNVNSKALYVIFCGIDLQEFKRISKSIIANEAWDILQTTHE